MNVKTRLESYLVSKKIKKTHFEASIGAANGFVNSIKRSISPDYLESIANEYPDINIEWLLFGKGEMLKSSDNTNIISGSVSESTVQYGGNMNSHNVSINGDLEGKKIIRPDQIEIKQESNAEEVLLQKVASLETEITRLVDTIRSKDETIDAQKQIIAAKDEMIQYLIKNVKQ